jgi:hypothetical protein
MGWSVTSDVTDVFLEQHGFSRLGFAIGNPTFESPYVKYRFVGTPYLDDNYWMIETELYECPYQLQSAWDRTTRQRQLLLQQSDWIVFDTKLPLKVRKQWESYRMALRLCTKITDRPEKVTFPTPPEKVSKLVQGWEDDRLTETEIQLLQNSSVSEPWTAFLNEWSRYEFSTVRSLVEALLMQHTGKALNEIIKRI